MKNIKEMIELMQIPVIAPDENWLNIVRPLLDGKSLFNVEQLNAFIESRERKAFVAGAESRIVECYRRGSTFEDYKLSGDYLSEEIAKR